MIGRFGMTHNPQFGDAVARWRLADREEDLLCSMKGWARALRVGDSMTVVRGDDGRLKVTLVRPQERPDAEST